MGSPRVDASNLHALPPSQLLRSLLASAPSPSFPAEPSMADFTGIRPPRPRRSEPQSDEEEEDEEEEQQLGSQAGKKRRLSPTQVQHLEKSFLVDNRLEPERKTRLATELHLQPRQVAIWFQNRRARFKTKQLQKDFSLLKSTFDSLQSRFDHLLTEKDLLHDEVCLLRAKLKTKETTESESPIQVQMEESPLPVVHQEEASSLKSDVVDSETPNSTSDFSQGDLTVPVAAQYAFAFGEADEEADFQGGFGVPALELEGQPSYWPWLYQ